MKTIYVRVGFKVHKKFKQLCQEGEVSMSDIIRDFIEKLVVDLEEENE